MGQRFFKLYDDVHAQRRWHLQTPRDGQGQELMDWDFTSGAPLDVQGRLRIPVEQQGRALDFSEAGTMIPVVHVRVASVFSELAPQDVQLIPVDIEGQPEQYLILVARRLIRCVDEKASRVRFWRPEDGLPDMVGQYRDIRDLHIDKSKVGEAKVFRPEGWEVALIISEDIKDALERMGATGTKFEEV
jgi:hypothetical protein